MFLGNFFVNTQNVVEVLKKLYTQFYRNLKIRLLIHKLL